MNDSVMNYIYIYIYEYDYITSQSLSIVINTTMVDQSRGYDDSW